MKTSGRRRIVVLALAVGACDRKAPPPPPPDVLVAPVIQRDVPVVSEWIGTLDGSVNAAIRPKVEGYLLRQRYKEGQFVRAGDLLFEIDPRQFFAAVEQSKGALGQAEAQLAKASRDVERFTPLAADRAVSQQELDDAVSAQRNAEAAVAAARAAVDQAALNLGWARITSPIAGIAGIAQAQVGDLVNGQTVMTTVSTVDPIRVTYGISEREYMAIATSVNRPDYAPVLELVLDDGSVYAHLGRAVLADREVDPGTGTMTIRGLFPNPGNILRPGQYAKVRATIETRTGALLVPQRALMELQGGFRIAVVNSKDEIEILSVEPAQRVGDLWVIAKGLQPGARVVVSGLQFVKPGMVVKARPFEAEAAADGAAPAPGAR